MPASITARAQEQLLLHHQPEHNSRGTCFSLSIISNYGKLCFSHMLLLPFPQTRVHPLPLATPKERFILLLLLTEGFSSQRSLVRRVQTTRSLADLSSNMLVCQAG